jgi:hypothetical protein
MSNVENVYVFLKDIRWNGNLKKCVELSVMELDDHLGSYNKTVILLI